MISFEPLRTILLKRGYFMYNFVKDGIISDEIATALKHDRKVNLRHLSKIALRLDCDVGDLCEWKSEK